MSSEWKPLEDITDVGWAQANGWEIEERWGNDWIMWMGKGWNDVTKYRGRPASKKVTVKLLGWFDGCQLAWLKEGAEPTLGSRRVPSEDKTVEVEE
jgi:hypothetical protein